MIPDYPRLKPIELKDILDIRTAVTALEVEESELAPANFFIWQDMEAPSLTRLYGNICILIRCKEEEYFLRPLGNNRLAATLEVCLRHAGKISRLSRTLCETIHLTHTQPNTLPDQFDYLYLRRDLAELKGSRYDGKRNHIRRFKAQYPAWSFRPFSPDSGEIAMKLFDTWCSGKADSVYFQPLAELCQRRALLRAFSHFESLNLIGGGIWDKEKLLGFIIGSPLNADTVVVHFQYGHPEAGGVMPLLLQEAAGSSFSNYQYINLEQDIGIAGLRKSKLSLHPLRMIEKYEVTDRTYRRVRPCISLEL